MGSVCSIPQPDLFLWDALGSLFSNPQPDLVFWGALGSLCSIPQPDLFFWGALGSVCSWPWAGGSSGVPPPPWVSPTGHTLDTLLHPKPHPSTSKTPNPNTSSRRGGSHSPSGDFNTFPREFPLPRGCQSEQGRTKPILNFPRSSAGRGAVPTPGPSRLGRGKAEPGFDPGAPSSIPAGKTTEQLLNQLGQPNGHPIMARGSQLERHPARSFLPLASPAGIWALPVLPGRAEPSWKGTFRSMNFSGARLAASILPAAPGLTPQGWGWRGHCQWDRWDLGWKRRGRWVWLLVSLSAGASGAARIGSHPKCPRNEQEDPSGCTWEAKTCREIRAGGSARIPPHLPGASDGQEPPAGLGGVGENCI